MNSKTLNRFVMLALLLVCFATVSWADAGGRLSVRSFQLRYKEPEKVAAAVKSLMSNEGSLSIQAGARSLVITDHVENLKNIAGAIEKFDVPARAFRLELKLIFAGRAPTAGKVPEDLKEIAAKLSGVLRFNTFEEVGGISVIGKEGDPIVARIDGNYRAEMKFGEYDPQSDSVRVSAFQLSRIVTSGSDSGQVEPLLTTNLNLRLGQTAVVGATRQPESSRALMLVLTAQRSE
ncbi:MAG: secretin N-terminal domain-containing protein [Acidobacteriota bacterium]